MQIDRLSLRGFRNYEDAQAQFVPGVNLLVGGNANGKTNLLEAVSYLSTGRSFRTRREAELIRFGADFAELRAQVQSQERTRELRAVLFTGRRPRQLWLAGVRQRSRAALSGVLTSVLFCPEDLMILKKGAAGRRRLMDGVICQLRPNYEAALAEYGRLLDQKSALLRERYDNPSLLQVLPEYDLRTAVISLKLAERALLRQGTGETPVLLLDDVLSELDAGRQDFVLNQLREGQVFITCCETDRLTSLGQVLSIRSGTIGGAQ